MYNHSLYSFSLEQLYLYVDFTATACHISLVISFSSSFPFIDQIILYLCMSFFEFWNVHFDLEYLLVVLNNCV